MVRYVAGMYLLSTRTAETLLFQRMSPSSLSIPDRPGSTNRSRIPLRANAALMWNTNELYGRVLGTLLRFAFVAACAGLALLLLCNCNLECKWY